jgi:NhaP-type Na+/H+ or K+/H+ antiporter
MGFVPASFEIAAVTIVAKYLLPFNWLEAALLGAILGAVSPAVVIPLMISFMERGKGAPKGISTFLLAGSALDNVFAIVIFTQFLGMFQSSRATWRAPGRHSHLRGAGVILGLAAGYLLYVVFRRFEFASPRNTIIVLGMAIVLTWIGDLANSFIPIASLIGVIAMGLVILEKEEGIAHLISQACSVFGSLLSYCSSC